MRSTHNIEQKWFHFFELLDDNRDDVLMPEDFERIAARLAEKRGFPSNHSVTKLYIQRARRFYDEMLVETGVSAIRAFQKGLTRRRWAVFMENILSSAEDSKAFRKFIGFFVSTVFTVFDRDGNGVIDRSEYDEIMEVLFINENGQSKGFEALDENGDGFISKKEFINGFIAYFTDERLTKYNYIFGEFRKSKFQFAS